MGHDAVRRPHVEEWAGGEPAYANRSPFGAQLREEFATEAFLEHVTDPERRRRCRRQRDALVRDHPDSPPFAGLADWAAFTAIGLTYPRPERATPDRISPLG